MVELTHIMLLELILVLIFVFVVASYASYVFGASMARISKKEPCLKKQIAYECEIDELYALEQDVLIGGHQIKIHELEQLLLGAKLDAKYMALDWAASQPNEAWAHWNLAKAYSQLGEYFEVKKTLGRIQKSHPGWNVSIEDWLEKVNAHLTRQGVECHLSPHPDGAS